MSKIRICYFIGSLKFGGAQKHLTDLINNLDRDIFEIFLVLAKNEGYFLKKLNLDHDHIFSLNLKRYYDWSGIKGFLKLIQFIWRKKIQIFHSYLFECNVYGAACRIFRPHMKYIMSIRNMNLTHSRKKIIATRAASWLSNHVTVVSKKVGKFVSEREQINPIKIKTIYNSVDSEAYSKDSKENTQYFDNCVNIVCVASLNFRKGHEYLFKAFKIITDQRNNVKLHLLGDGKNRPHLGELAQSLFIEEQIIFAGYVQNVNAYLEKMDIFVLSSFEEGMSNALLEGMSTGIPAVTTDVGGNSEVNIDGETGFVVPSANSKRLAESLMQLVEDKSLRRKMGENCRERIKTYFSVDNMIQNYSKFYFNDVLDIDCDKQIYYHG